MTEPDCTEMGLLVQADIDGELQPAEAARVAAHVEHCAQCTQTQLRLLALSNRIHEDAPRYAASASLRAAIVAASQPPRQQGRTWRPKIFPVSVFGGGFALAAALAAFLVLPRAGGLPEGVVGAHIRALQPGHLTDVVSTDEHTVKPWFDGRLPFAPPVKDFAGAGFPLLGGRLDYIAGHTAAAMVYRSDRHLIDVFAWPASPTPASSGTDEGYHYQRWSQDGMSLWAVSDLNPEELAAFVRRWQAP